jgi:DNA modification methylase
VKGTQTKLGSFSSASQSEEPQLVPESYTGMYAMHKYWSKKPFNLVRNLILKYSNKDDIVMDPFCGSGISIIESILTHRIAVGVDINPAAIFITKEMLMKIPPKEIEKEFNKIQNDCEEQINDLYAVKRDEEKLVGTHFIWKKNDLTEVWYLDRNGKKLVSKPHLTDVELAQSFSYGDTPFYYPQAKLFHNARINAKSNMHVYDLFTPRNIHALSIILNRIEKIKNQEMKNLFKFCFTAALGQASKMVFVINKRGKFNGDKQQERKEVGSWVIGYWIPKENFEINAWNCFASRFNRILKAKKEQYILDYEIKPTEKFSELQNNNLFLENDSSLHVLKKLPNNSIDYIITDPPHGNRLPYLELSMMWNSWLGNTVNYDDEIIVSEAKDRQKNLANYNILLGKVLTEIDRVLKPNKYFTLMFNSLDDDTWNDLLTMIKDLGLELHDIGTMDYSATSVVQDNRRRGLKTDFVLTFKKTKVKRNHEIKFLSGNEEKKQIKLLIDNFMMKNNNAETYQILNHIITNSLKENKFFRLADVISVIEDEFASKIKTLKSEIV